MAMKYVIVIFHIITKYLATKCRNVSGKIITQYFDTHYFQNIVIVFEAQQFLFKYFQNKNMYILYLKI